MSPEAPTDIVLTNSVVSFDGRVLELFGHAARTGNRIHLAQITNIVEDEGKVVITVRGGIDYSILLGGEDEAARTAIASLIGEVRQAAPWLQSG